MGWIGCIRCEKFRHDFVGWTFALFALIQPILDRVSRSNEMVPNAPKHYETQQRMSLGSNGGGLGAFIVKTSDATLWHELAFIAPVQPILHRVSCSNKMVQNAPKHYETHQNMSLRSDGVDRVDLLQKIVTQLCGLNFCINYNSSARFEASIVKQQNWPKCPQTLGNKTKHEFRVQWGGSDAFIAKNSDTTLWDELFHYLHQFSPFCTEFHAVTKWSQMHPNTMKRSKTRRG